MAEYPYICGLCGMPFPRMKHLERHTKKHKGQDKFHQCFVCNKVFSKASQLIHHSRTLIGGKPCNCCICGKELAAITSLEYHGTLHRNGFFNNQSNRQTKYPSVPINAKHYKCSLCCMQLKSSTALERHMAVHHSAEFGEMLKTNVCGVCGRAYTNEGQHRARHGGQEQVPRCFICDKTFDDPSQLQHHSKTLIYTTPYSCCICGKKCFCPSDLDQHGFQHRHGRVYSCPDCGVQLTSYIDFRKHVSLHKEEALFQCSFCERSYLTSRGLDAHFQLKHYNNLPFRHACAVCGASFQRQDDLEKHVLTHMNCFCTLCGEGFSSQAHLKKHMFEHREERHNSDTVPSKRGQNHANLCTCSLCGKGFSSQGHLKKHMFVHREERHNSESAPCKKRQKASNIGTQPLAFYERDERKKSAVKKLVRIQIEEVQLTDCFLCVQGFESAHVLKDHLAAHDVKIICS